LIFLPFAYLIFLFAIDAAILRCCCRLMIFRFRLMIILFSPFSPLFRHFRHAIYFLLRRFLIFRCHYTILRFADYADYFLSFLLLLRHWFFDYFHFADIFELSPLFAFLLSFLLYFHYFRHIIYFILFLFYLFTPPLRWFSLDTPLISDAATLAFAFADISLPLWLIDIIIDYAIFWCWYAFDIDAIMLIIDTPFRYWCHYYAYAIITLIIYISPFLFAYSLIDVIFILFLFIDIYHFLLLSITIYFIDFHVIAGWLFIITDAMPLITVIIAYFAIADMPCHCFIDDISADAADAIAFRCHCRHDGWLSPSFFDKSLAIGHHWLRLNWIMGHHFLPFDYLSFRCITRDTLLIYLDITIFWYFWCHYHFHWLAYFAIIFRWY